LEGISYCHEKGVCHRDLKPENIIIDEHRRIKIIDFGFSASSRINLNNFCGTPAYMSPELVRKVAYNGAKADIWALGVILYLMLIGVFPFRAGNEQ
jgi:5'-AMP-activated protein kinase catalytic alpha subunit